MQLMNMNFKRIAIISGCIMLFGILFGFFIFPMLLKKMIKGQLNLTPKSSIRELYTKVPFPIEFRIYVWNVTNKEEVIKGGKPKLQQVGPYYFEEWKEKFDLVDDPATDTLTYHYRNKFLFRADLSGPGLTGDETITMPNPFIMGMLLALNIDKKPMLPGIASAINDLFNNPTDPFFTGRIMDILYDGIPINCTSEEFNTVALCTMFSTGAQQAVRKVDDKHYAFSLFGGANNTDLGKFTVYRGKNVSHDIGRVVSFNDDTEMDVWDADECNQYVGTDSTIFPPFMKKEEGIWAHEPSICRALGATYKSKAKYNGLPVLRYELDMSDKVNVKDCFCRNPGECPLKGTIDLYRCVGSPMIASHPHFYLGDSQLLENIASGMSPNKKDHGIYLLFEIMSGTPVSAAKRLQFNLDVVGIPEVEIMKDLRKMVFPLFWIEEGAHLSPAFTNQLKKTLFLAVKIQNVIKWLCTIVGAIGCILAGYMMYKNQGNRIEVKELPPQDIQNPNSITRERNF